MDFNSPHSLHLCKQGLTACCSDCGKDCKGTLDLMGGGGSLQKQVVLSFLGLLCAVLARCVPSDPGNSPSRPHT